MLQFCKIKYKTNKTFRHTLSIAVGVTIVSIIAPFCKHFAELILEICFMSVTKIKTFFVRFGILDAIRFVLAEATRKSLDSYNIGSYFQTGEDRILSTLLAQYG
jgi:hypothetical protein